MKRISLLFRLLAILAIVTIDSPLLQYSTSAEADSAKPTDIFTSAGKNQTCFLNDLGSVRCWGSAMEQPDSDEVFISISSGSGTCGVTSEHKVVCWGQDNVGRLIPNNLDPVKEIKISAYTACARTLANQLRCWGEAAPTDIPDVEIIDFGVGLSHVCLVDTMSKVQCFGYGEGTWMPRDLGPIKQLAVGGNASCALREDGSYACWGSYGRLEGGMPEQGSVQEIHLGLYGSSCWREVTRVRCSFWAGSLSSSWLGAQISVGMDHVCGVATDKRVFCGGSIENGKSRFPIQRLYGEHFYVVVESARDSRASLSIVLKEHFYPKMQYKVFLKQNTVCELQYYENCSFGGLVDGQTNTVTVESVFGSRTIQLNPKTSFKSVGLASIKRAGLFTLRAEVGTWDPSPALSFTWLKNGQEILNENQQSLYIVPADLGSSFQVKITGDLAPYEDRSVLSPTLETKKVSLPCIANPDPSIWMRSKSAPAISGKPVIGEVLKAANGVWGKGFSLCSFWYSNSAAISPRGSSSYTVRSTDAGKYLQYVVVGTEKSGSSLLRFSEPILALKKSFASAKAPAISGKLGLGDKLTGVPTKWENGTTFTSQWLKLGVEIKGASKSTYLIQESDLGSKIQFRICGSKKDFQSKCLVSAAKSIPLGEIKPIPKVALSLKTSKVGDVLNLNTGVWPAGVTLTIAWLRDSTPIAQQSSSTYTISNSDRGRILSASVIASKPGYKSIVLPIAIGKIP